MFSATTTYKGQKYIINYLPQVQDVAIGNCGMRMLQRATITEVVVYKDGISETNKIFPAVVSNARFGSMPSHDKSNKQLVNSIVSSARFQISETIFHNLIAPYAKASGSAPYGMQILITDGINGDRSSGIYVEYTMGYRTSDFMGWLLAGNAKEFVSVYPGPITWNQNHPNPEMPSLVQCLMLVPKNVEVYKLGANNKIEFTKEQLTYLKDTYTKTYSGKPTGFWDTWFPRFFENLYYSGKREE